MWSLHGFLHGIKQIMFHGHLDYFQKPPLQGGSNTNPDNHGTPNAHHHWFIPCDQVWGCCMNRKTFNWHLVEGPVTYDFTLCLRARDHTTWFWKCLEIAFGHFLLGSHNSMVKALGSCVKWPSISFIILVESPDEHDSAKVSIWLLTNTHWFIPLWTPAR